MRDETNLRLNLRSNAAEIIRPQMNEQSDTQYCLIVYGVMELIMAILHSFCRIQRISDGLDHLWNLLFCLSERGIIPGVYTEGI